MAKKLSFEQWQKMVDQFVSAYCGLSFEDFPDCPYADWYENGVSAKTAAKRCIKRSADY